MMHCKLASYSLILERTSETSLQHTLLLSTHKFAVTTITPKGDIPFAAVDNFRFCTIGLTTTGQTTIHCIRQHRQSNSSVDELQCSHQCHQYRHFDVWNKEGMFGEKKTAIIDGWEPNWKALACL